MGAEFSVETIQINATAVVTIQIAAELEDRSLEGRIEPGSMGSRLVAEATESLISGNANRRESLRDDLANVTTALQDAADQYAARDLETAHAASASAITSTEKDCQ